MDHEDNKIGTNTEISRYNKKHEKKCNKPPSLCARQTSAEDRSNTGLTNNLNGNQRCKNQETSRAKSCTDAEGDRESTNQ